jgi:hypothetical protein
MSSMLCRKEMASSPIETGISMSFVPWHHKIGMYSPVCMICLDAMSALWYQSLELWLTSRIRQGIHPDKLATPPSSCNVVSPTIRLNAAPWLNPTSTILRESIPECTWASIMFSINEIDSEMPISSYSFLCGGRRQTLNQAGRRWPWLKVTGLSNLSRYQYPE